MIWWGIGALIALVAAVTIRRALIRRVNRWQRGPLTPFEAQINREEISEDARARQAHTAELVVIDPRCVCGAVTHGGGRAARRKAAGKAAAAVEAREAGAAYCAAIVPGFGEDTL